MDVHVFNSDGEEIATFTAVAATIQVPNGHARTFDPEAAITQLSKTRPTDVLAILVDRNPFESDGHPEAHRVKAGDHALGAESR